MYVHLLCGPPEEYLDESGSGALRDYQHAEFTEIINMHTDLNT